MCISKHDYFIDTEIYPQKSLWIKFVLILNVANQKYERQNFTMKIIVRPISNANDEISLMMNERTEENVMREPLHKTRALWKMAEGRFASVYSVEEFILEHENKNTAQKTCCWEIFKLLFTLFIAPFVLFVYQRQHEKISAPMK